MNKKISFFLYVVLMLLFNLLLGVLLFRFIYDEHKLAFEGFFPFAYIASILIGLILTYKTHRTWWSAIAVVSIPYGIYCLIAYPGTGTIITSILFLISLVFVAVDIFIKRIPKKADKEVIMMIRIKKLIYKAHNLTGFFSLVLVCIVLVSCITTAGAASSNGLYERKTEISFSLQNWNDADMHQKEEYAQLLLDYECNKLNIKPLTLSVEKMPETRLAYYSDSQNSVVLNKNHLKKDSLLSVCNSIAHESFHSLEYSLIYNEACYSGNADLDKNITKKISAYKSEFTDYKEYNSEKALNAREFYDYYYQTCETDARSYGDSESVVLFKLILSNG